MKRILYVGNKLSNFGFTPTGIEFLGGLLADQGYPVMYAGENRNKLIRLLTIVRIILVDRKRYDVILIDTYSSSAFYYAVVSGWLARFLEKPYIPILRGGNLPQRLNDSPFLIKQLFNRAQRVVSVSHYLQQVFSTIRPIDLIPNFIELANYPFKKRDKLSPRLLWVRSFHQIYNPQLAVRIVAALKLNHPDVSLTMVGPDKDGSMMEVRQLAKELGVERNIKITGKLSKEEWIKRAADHDIFINTTNFDNMPVSVVEAMALGLPVISTNVGGIPYLIDHLNTGYLVVRDDLKTFCIAIEELLSNPVLGQTLSINAREKVLEFDKIVVLKQWMNILEGV